MLDFDKLVLTLAFRLLAGRHPFLRLGLPGLGLLDAHLSENRQDFLDLHRIGLLRGQHGVDLIDCDVAALLGAADQLLDGRVGKVERSASGMSRFSGAPRMFFSGPDIACHNSLPTRRGARPRSYSAE